jgi:2-amino-4-hydroxy-6-hydroxymethyldihydropteridine diphosphokinase
MRHTRYGPPRNVLAAAIEALEAEGLTVLAVSPVAGSDPLGPSRRRYANAVAVITTPLEPEALLGTLQQMERAFGRRRRGIRWGARVLDLDIVLWSGGPWTSERLLVPHPEFRSRAFVLGPAVVVAPAWRDPVTGRTPRQLRARLTRAKPLP